MDQDRLNLIVNMLEKNPDDSFLNYAAALEFRKNGKIDNAIELLKKLSESDPAYLGTYYQLGKLYEEVGLEENAVNIYRKGREIATEQNDLKTLGELSEALMLLDVD